MIKKITWDNLPSGMAKSAKKNAIELLKDRLKMPSLSKTKKEEIRKRIQIISKSS